MKKKKIRPRDIKRFEEHLYSEEKSKATIEKYIRDIKKFSVFSGIIIWTRSRRSGIRRIWRRDILRPASIP